MQRRPGPSPWLVLIATSLGLGMLMVDTFVVNVAFPAIGRSLRADLSTAEWTVSGYVLVVGVLPIAMGRLGDILGRRLVYLGGLVVFVAASAACGFAQNIEQLIAFRVVQGIGAATMMPGTLSIITQAFPPQKRGLAIGIWGGVSGLGLIAGPILGGLLVHGDSWRWIFYINLPLGAVAILLALLFIPESRDESAPRSIDWPGVAVLSGALFAIMFGLTRANDAGWASPLILGCFAAGAIGLPAFVAIERRTRYPVVDLSLFRSGTFVMACVSAFLFSAAMFGSQPFMSLFLQNYWGYSPLKGGLAFVPATLIVASLMPVSGILGQRLGPKLRLIVIAGSLCVSISFLYMLLLDLESSYADGLLPAFIIRGVGIGLVMSATSLAVVNAVPLAKSGLASGTLTMARNIGTSVGIAILGAVFIHHVHAELPVRLEGAPPHQVEAATRAADVFIVAGEPGSPVHSAAERVILDGFILVSGAAAIGSLIATGAACFIRYRTPAATPVPSPAAGRVEAEPAAAPAQRLPVVDGLPPEPSPGGPGA
jgi:DHA2 family methylenomycin A resistance protein-like MFS transporter